MCESYVTFGVAVRNIYHEPITVSIDRIDVGRWYKFSLETAHRYSDFEYSNYGDVRLIKAPGYYVKPAPVYPVEEVANKDKDSIMSPTYLAHVIYSSSYENRVFAYVTHSSSIHLARGGQEIRVGNQHTLLGRHAVLSSRGLRHRGLPSWCV